MNTCEILKSLHCWRVPAGCSCSMRCGAVQCVRAAGRRARSFWTGRTSSTSPSTSTLRLPNSFTSTLHSYGTPRPLLLGRDPARPCQHCSTQFPRQTPQRPRCEPERVPASRDASVLLQPTTGGDSATGRHRVQTNYSTISAVSGRLKRSICTRGSGLIHCDSCASGLTVETTSWEPLRQAEEAKKQTAGTTKP